MSSIVVSGDTSGAITVAAPTTAGTSTLTLPSGASGTIAAQGVSTNIVSGTAVASTSGTSINFTDIPSWVKRITVMFNGVSTNGTSLPLIQLGTGGTPTTTGYVSSSTAASTAVSTTSSTSGFVIFSNTAAYAPSGVYVFNLVSGNIWTGAGTLANSATVGFTIVSGGVVTLAGTLDRIRITTVNGTDTFDAGTINILYE
jgi:hypothetical protein